MSTVWVVTRGENQSGGSVIGVRKEREAAIQLALAEPIRDSGGTEWLPHDEHRWECGCDFVEIAQFEVL
jgi:hypothetical protein